ncbi:hypothetical protein [Actinophytocola sp. NPDC049390]|uniref:hypothetical protein n=1 Tax=Actinophytocola sp. NPDC049390 TaxID=3363894 RepID=UPI003796C77A
MSDYIEPRSAGTGPVDAFDTAFLDAAVIGLDLVSRPAVRDRWSGDSALPLMSVGMLACHLGRQLVHAQTILSSAAAGEPLDGAADHYRRAAWVTAESLDDPANDRTNDLAEAEQGFDAMVERCAAALTDARRMLEGGTAHDVVTIPWQGWSLDRADFLLTRMVEIVTHADDLARSVDVATPRFPAPVYAPVCHLLVDMAVERHGQAAMTSALTRGERMPATISAF